MVDIKILHITLVGNKNANNNKKNLEQSCYNAFLAEKESIL